MEIVRYSKSFEEQWDTFVDNSRNGTIFHKQRFLSYHEEGKFVDHSLLVFRKNKLVAVFPAIDVNGTTLKSHGGSSYGGPVFGFESGMKIVWDTMEAIEEHAKDFGFDSIEMRICPRVLHKYPSEDVDYILWYLGYKNTYSELSTAVQLYSDNVDMENFHNDTKRSVNRAFNCGVVVKESDGWQEFWEILSGNLDVKHRAVPTHSVDEIIKLKTLFPNDIYLFAGYINEKMAAGSVVFKCNSVAYHTFYIAQDCSFQEARPLNAVFYNLISNLKAKGYRYLNFGISTESAGTAINEGLFRFKEGFGARGTVRRYYKKDL